MPAALKPTVLPRFAETAAGVPASNITAPTSGQQDTGWTTGQAPPSSVFNWLLRYIYDWVQYLRDGAFTATAGSALSGASGVGDGAASGLTGTGGASGSGVSATAGGGGAPVRGALALTVQNAPSAAVAGDMWVDALGAMLKTGSGASAYPVGPIATSFIESFEATTFPPAGTPGWAAPSPRFGSDLAYQRSTASPIAGVASAQRNSGQLASQSSSMGLTLLIPSPSRIRFRFNVICNPNGDFLNFNIDGVQFASISARGTAGAPIVQVGTYISEVLSEGLHTFDWRFIRGAAVSVAGETAQADDVEIIPESRWMDSGQYAYETDHFVQNASAGESVGWSFTNPVNAGAGTASSPSTNAPGFTGEGWGWNIASGNSSGDVRTMYNNNINIAGARLLNCVPLYLECAVNLRTAVASMGFCFGWLSDVIIAASTLAQNNGACVHYDPTIGATIRLRVNVSGTPTDIDTGIIPVINTWYRFALIIGVDGKISLTVNGKMVPGASGVFGFSTATPISGVSAQFAGFAAWSRAAVTNANLGMRALRFFGKRASA